jgi:hypothetical protein
LPSSIHVMFPAPAAHELSSATIAFSACLRRSSSAATIGDKQEQSKN